ncbi:uncharacterized protein PHACADRAFT_191430 [Phanerochaete carnosa HHB-10118-sp]|uniref:H-type lectin domain-containing protein n=1 Tax=Phanerochaete carnosa (strain HHB-10118-sp) TaxID=650164 RepID=K5X8A6_PHACS|nr:uncharacterized protein PHACADRAFT_191430 [Phanerochaete carnosa HHB-10118-sp]EKM59117.1 hypothetical protein PHACADRAFT_191430 [Phanerochaete carnosa HHB-10118-sp]
MGGISFQLAHAETPISYDLVETPALVVPTPTLELGEFRTTSVRSEFERQATTCTTLFFTQPHGAPPTVVLGLNQLDLSPIVRLRAQVRSAERGGAHIGLSAWSTTTHFSSGCAWLAEDFPFGRKIPQKQVYVAFARPYATPPCVVAWLDTVDCCMWANARAAVWAGDVTERGFTLYFKTWLGSRLWQVGASWLAYPADRTDIRSGTFSTEQVCPTLQRQHEHRGRVEWEPTERPPRVFTALSMLDFEKWKNLRVRLTTSDVTTTGMAWNIDSWHDTVMHKAAAVYITFDI